VIVEIHERGTVDSSPNPVNINGSSIPTEPKVIVRPEEALIVILALLLWVGAIALFFNRWGKIRMLEPYQPKFEEKHRTSCPLVDYPMGQSFATSFDASNIEFKRVEKYNYSNSKPSTKRQSLSRMSMGMSMQMPMPSFQCSLGLGASNPYRGRRLSAYPMVPYSRPRQNSVFVGPHMVSPPQQPRKTRSAVDIHSLIQSEGIVEDV